MRWLKCANQTNGLRCTRVPSSLLRCPHLDPLPCLLCVIRCSCLCLDIYLMCNHVTGAWSETRQAIRLQAGLLTCYSAATDSATFSANFSACGICYSSHCSCCASARDLEWKRADQPDGEFLMQLPDRVYNLADMSPETQHIHLGPTTSFNSWRC